MTWTRVALDILSIPECIHERDSDYDATSRLLTALVEGINYRYDPRLNESNLYYACDTLS